MLPIIKPLQERIIKGHYKVSFLGYLCKKFDTVGEIEDYY